MGMSFSSPINAVPCFEKPDVLVSHHDIIAVLATVSKSTNPTQVKTIKSDSTFCADHSQPNGLSSDPDRVHRHSHSGWTVYGADTDLISESCFSSLHERAPPSL
jgi:hypothetical protein